MRWELEVRTKLKLDELPLSKMPRKVNYVTVKLLQAVTKVSFAFANGFLPDGARPEKAKGASVGALGISASKGMLNRKALILDRCQLPKLPR